MEKEIIDNNLRNIIISNPSGVAELMESYGFEGNDPAYLVRAAIRDRENFVDKLENVVPEGFDGFENAEGKNKREKLSNILNAAINVLGVADTFIKPNQQKEEKSGPEVRIKPKEDRNSKILGIPKAIFFLGISVLVLILVFVFLSQKK
jgi:hypothetical protein